MTLNLVDASVAEAAKIDPRRHAGVELRVSERVKGTITIQTTKAIPRDALLETFEVILRGEGAAIVVEQGIYRIVPTSDAIASARLRGKGSSYRRVPGVSSQIVPLQYVAAAEMERILKAIAPNANLLRTDTARNLLIVSGTRADLDQIVDAVSVFDVDWMKGMSFGLFPVESGDPDAIAQELDTVFANDRDSPTKGIVRFIPNRRLKSILVISSRPEYLRRAETCLGRLDMATRATVKQVLSIQYAAAVPSSSPSCCTRFTASTGSQDQASVALKAPAPSPYRAGRRHDGLRQGPAEPRPGADPGK